MSENNEQKECIDLARRRFLTIATGAVGAVGALCTFKPLLSSLMPNAHTLESAKPIEVDLAALAPGQMLSLLWQGKPVWVLRRTPEMLQNLAKDSEKLRDPLSLVPQQPAYAKNIYRSINPEYLVLIGLCTHLGCTPKYTPQAKTGFFCPCHGSTFDLAGRVYKDVPAPVNLQVPPHYFKSATRLIIGQHSDE